MTIVSETEHVQVFKINTKINRMKQMSFRLYPKARPVPEALDASSPAGIAIRLALLEVVEQCRCRTMFALQSHERAPGSRRNSCSGCRDVVVQATKK